MDQNTQNSSTSESMEDYTQELEASFRKIKEGDVISGTIIAATDTEVIIDLNYYAEGIILAEDYSEDPSFSIKTDVPIGETIQATVIAEDDGQGNLLLSRKEAVQTLSWDILAKYQEEGTILTVKVSEIVKGGAVAYVEGIRGFIPASKLALTYVENLEEWLHKEIQVQVLQVESTERKLILSAKELLKEEQAKEQSRLVSNVQVGLVTEGVVESLQNYGAFVRLSNGVSGLVHISQICQKRISHPSNVLKEGQTVHVKVIAIKDGKISLSMKALEDVAAEEIREDIVDLPQSESIGTNLSSLFKNLKLD